MVAQYGADTSSDVLRQKARCTKCGNRGASLLHPSWISMGVGFERFPGDPMPEVSRPVLHNSQRREPEPQAGRPNSAAGAGGDKPPSD